MRQPTQKRAQNQPTSVVSWIWCWSIRKGVMAFILILGIIPIINAQSAGSRGGVHGYADQSGEQQRTGRRNLAIQKVEEYIAVDSKVELRVKPDQIRIVLAVGEAAESASQCEEKVFSKIAELKATLVELGVKPEDIVDDFIAILPRYEFEVEELKGKKYAVEKLLDYSMQSNLHIKVPNDDLAMKTIRAAFKLEVTNIIAYDYWSSKLDEVKRQSLESALKQAKSKADLLLGETFSNQPAPINVVSDTKVITPGKLYESFENVHSQTVGHSYRNDIPSISAFRPKNTYYKGYVDPHADVQPKSVSMNCEISVVSTVQLFYASPVSNRFSERSRSELASTNFEKSSHRNIK